MEFGQIINILGYFAFAAVAGTLLFPLAIAMKNCRAKKRRKKQQKFSAQHARHSLT